MPLLRHLPRARLGAALAGLLLGVLLAVPGCGGDERGPFPVEPGPQRPGPERPVPPGATARDRFGLPPLVEYVAPEGWERLPPNRLRIASLRIPGEGTDVADVSVTRFRGGALENLNRWRGQFGLEPVAEADLAALPRSEVFGSPAVRAEFEGDFVGMGEGEPLRGYALVGLIQEVADGGRWFVKLVGPKALVAQHRERFERFRASLRVADFAAPRSPEPEPPRGLDPRRLRWDLPQGWKDEPSTKPMRVKDVRVEGAPGVEGVLSVLAGHGGGEALNLNRWRKQMGAEELSEAEIAALPRIEMLGRQAVWIEIAGRYRGMSGEDIPEALFVGVVCLLEDGAVFVRLTGPRALVEPRREEFRALCRSLRLEG